MKTESRLVGFVAALWCCLSGWLLTGEVGAAPDRSLGVRKANWELAAHWGPDQIADRLPSLEVVPNWLGDGDQFWYRFRTGSGTSYWLVDPPRGTRVPLFDHPALATALTRLSGEAIDAAHLELQDLEVEGGGALLRFTVAEQRYEFTRETNQLVSIEAPENREVPDWCSEAPDGSRCVFARGNNLFLLSLDGADEPEVQLTRDGEPGWAWGDPWKVVEPTDLELRQVAAVWSPDSKRVAMQRADSRTVADYWIVNHLDEPRPSLTTVKLPLPGEVVPQWQVWVVGDPRRLGPLLPPCTGWIHRAAAHRRSFQRRGHRGRGWA